jgi:hypothetical protein
MEGSKPLIQAKNREAVLALREIAAEKVEPNLEAPSLPIEPPEVRELEEEAALLEAEIEEVSVDQMVLSEPLDEAGLTEITPEEDADVAAEPEDQGV